MFFVAYGRDLDGKDRNKICLAGAERWPVKTLQEAKALRKVSGDLVFMAISGVIVPSQNWLFDWEKDKPDCYAQQCINRKVRVREERFEISLQEWQKALGRVRQMAHDHWRRQKRMIGNFINESMHMRCE